MTCRYPAIWVLNDAQHPHQIWGDGQTSALQMMSSHEHAAALPAGQPEEQSHVSIADTCQSSLHRVIGHLYKTPANNSGAMIVCFLSTPTKSESLHKQLLFVTINARCAKPDHLLAGVRVVGFGEQQFATAQKEVEGLRTSS